MMLHTLSSRLLATHLLVAIVAISLVGVLSSQLFRHYYIAQSQASLQQAGEDLATTVGRVIGQPGGQAQVDLITHSASRVLGGRVCVFNAEQTALLASSEPKAGAEATRDADLLVCGPEASARIEKAEARCYPGPVISVVAPIRDPTTGERRGVILLRRSLVDVEATLRLSSYLAALSGVLAAALALGLGLLLSRAIARPLDKMAQAAAGIAEGNFETRVEREGPLELRTMAASLNHMAGALAAAFAELRSERERLADILASMAEGVVSLDNEGRVTLTNDSARELLGGSASLSGARLADVVGETDALSELLGGETDAAEATVQVGGRALRLHASRIHAAEGGFVVVIADVTEAERLERLRREFVANASHELRAPLTSIQGFLGALADGTAETEQDRQRCLRVAAQQADLMRRLVDQLLDLSRLQAGVAPMDTEPLDLRPILAATADALSPQAAEKRVAIRLDAPARLPVRADGDRVMQVLTNLVDNAIRYSPEGGEVHVTAAMDGEGDAKSVRVAVRDEGGGIPEEDLPLIWERFHKADRSRRRDQGGAGLGLAIAREIVLAHGGEVWAENHPQGGAVLGFSLPTAVA